VLNEHDSLKAAEHAQRLIPSKIPRVWSHPMLSA
jgi:hypothetical protein